MSFTEYFLTHRHIDFNFLEKGIKEKHISQHMAMCFHTSETLLTTKRIYVSMCLNLKSVIIILN
jgi:hypothetical protein